MTSDMSLKPLTITSICDIPLIAYHLPKSNISTLIIRSAGMSDKNWRQLLCAISSTPTVVKLVIFSQQLDIIYHGLFYRDILYAIRCDTNITELTVDHLRVTHRCVVLLHDHVCDPLCKLQKLQFCGCVFDPFAFDSIVLLFAMLCVPTCPISNFAIYLPSGVRYTKLVAHFFRKLKDVGRKMDRFYVNDLCKDDSERDINLARVVLNAPIIIIGLCGTWIDNHFVQKTLFSTFLSNEHTQVRQLYLSTEYLNRSVVEPVMMHKLYKQPRLMATRPAHMLPRWFVTMIYNANLRHNLLAIGQPRVLERVDKKKPLTKLPVEMLRSIADMIYQ